MFIALIRRRLHDRELKAESLIALDDLDGEGRHGDGSRRRVRIRMLLQAVFVIIKTTNRSSRFISIAHLLLDLN